MDKFYGICRAVVVDDNDPLNQLRLKAALPEIGGDPLWAVPCLPAGLNSKPSMEDVVCVMP